MGKRSVKSRRSGTSKVIQKNNTFAKYIPPKINDQSIKEKWDPRKTPRHNMAQLGLQHDINGIKSNIQTYAPSEVPLYDIPTSNTIQTDDKTLPNRGDGMTILKSNRIAKNSTKHAPMTTGDQKYISRCLDKHGVDYTKMFRDTKVNKMQHTKGKLEKMGKIFFKLTVEQRVKEVPERVLELIDEHGTE